MRVNEYLSREVLYLVFELQLNGSNYVCWSHRTGSEYIHTRLELLLIQILL